MSFRVTDNTINERLKSQINNARQKQAIAQEQAATGRRINRPSDDPFGTAVVIDLRNSQNSLEQFKKVAEDANNNLTVSDSAVDSYQRILERINSLLSQAVSDSTSSQKRQLIATDIDGIAQDVLKIANTQSGNRFIFGGTQQDQPPFDPLTSVPNPNTAFSQQVQLEPNSATTQVDVLASDVFSSGGKNIFEELSTIATALRGTADPVADKATLTNGLTEINGFIQQANIARTKIGKGLNIIENTLQRISDNTFSIESAAQDIEAADFAKTATELVESGRALDAILATSSKINRRSLLDFLG